MARFGTAGPGWARQEHGKGAESHNKKEENEMASKQSKPKQSQSKPKHLGIRAATIAGLLARGWRHLPITDPRVKSGKYEVFAKRIGDGSGGLIDFHDLFFVGSSGALRSGRTVAESVSWTGSRLQKELIAVGRGEKAP